MILYPLVCFPVLASQAPNALFHLTAQSIFGQAIAMTFAIFLCIAEKSLIVSRWLSALWLNKAFKFCIFFGSLMAFPIATPYTMTPLFFIFVLCSLALAWSLGAPSVSSKKILMALFLLPPPRIISLPFLIAS